MFDRIDLQDKNAKLNAKASPAALLGLTMDKKIASFKRFLRLLIVASHENNRDSITRLDSFKMLFLGIQGLSPDKKNHALGMFPNWWALANGPVESDAYNWIKETYWDKVRLDTADWKEKVGDLWSSSEFDDALLVEIISQIKEQDLLKKDTFDLVETTHAYASWADAYRSAVRSWRKSAAMPKESILNDCKV